jgi:cell division protein FtsI/penicillin-binding protein 2
MGGIRRISDENSVPGQGLAPRRNPEIIVAVLYQGGLHGYLAAPLARDVIGQPAASQHA